MKSQISGVLPTEEPEATPILPSRMEGSSARPASASASSAERTANWDTRPMLRSCLRVQWSGGAKPATGAARRVPRSVSASHSGIRRTALCPARKRASTSGQVEPKAVMPPRPVTTTRRISTARR